MNQSRFWAKTGQGEKREDGQPKYHPVICHLADTAALMYQKHAPSKVEFSV